MKNFKFNPENNKMPPSLTSYVPYKNGSISGRTVQELLKFPLNEIPWEKIKHDSNSNYSYVKSSSTRFVIRTTWGEPPLDLYVKRYKTRNFKKALTHFFHPPKGIREFELLCEMMKIQIPAPVPLLYGVQREGKLIRYNYLITKSMGLNILTLKDLVNQSRSSSERRKYLSQAATFLKESNDRGFYHDDCRADHIVFLPNSKNDSLSLAFIDVDNARLQKKTLSLNQRCKHIFQIIRSFRHGKGLSLRDKFEFVRACSGITDSRQLRSIIRSINCIAWRKIKQRVI